MNVLEYEDYQEKKTHVDVTFPYNTYIYSIPLDFHEVPLHWHDDLSMEYEKIIFNVNMLFSRTENVSSTGFLRPLQNGQLTVPSIYSVFSEHYAALSTCLDACDEICKTKPLGYELNIKGNLYDFFYILSNRYRNEKIQGQ